MLLEGFGVANRLNISPFFFFVSGDSICRPCRAYFITKVSWRNLSWADISIPRSRRGITLVNHTLHLDSYSKETSSSTIVPWTKKEHDVWHLFLFFPCIHHSVTMGSFFSLFHYLVDAGWHWHRRTHSFGDVKTGKNSPIINIFLLDFFFRLMQTSYNCKERSSTTKKKQNLWKKNSEDLYTLYFDADWSPRRRKP